MKKEPWKVNKKITLFFAISHIVGWVIAWAQTMWIIKEIKEIKKIIRG
jgi:hypothetical protein